jgi:hypothetical protein
VGSLVVHRGGFIDTRRCQLDTRRTVLALRQDELLLDLGASARRGPDYGPELVPTGPTQSS